MKLLLINPNTTAAVTDTVLQAARAVASPGTELVGVTGRFGAAYVASRAAYAIAAHAALDAWAAAEAAHKVAPFDAVLLACFGDPGLEALQELSAVPVIGMADAAIRQAASQGRHFGIVTGGKNWDPMLREFVAARGLSSQLASIQTVVPTGGDIARNPNAAMSLLADACIAAAIEGAEIVILAGAGLAGLTPSLKDRVGVPLIDSVQAAMQAAEARARA